MRTLALKNSEQVALVDDALYERLRQSEWLLARRGGRLAAMQLVATVWKYETGEEVAGVKKQELLHRVVMGIRNPQVIVTAKNGNYLDCRRENLMVGRRAKKQTPKE